MFTTVEKNIESKKSAPLYLMIAEQLKNKIISGELPDGSSLPSESKLAESFGVNHLTLRKGLRILSAQNLIIHQHGRGNFVSYKKSSNLKIGLLNVMPLPQSRFKMILTLEFINQLISIGGSPVFLHMKNHNREKLLQDYNASGCNGLVVIGPDEYIVEMFKSDEFKYIPVYFVTSATNKIKSGRHCSIGLNHNSVKDGIEYLKGLGHKKIAYISIESKFLFSITDRNNAFVEASGKDDLIFLGEENEPWDIWGNKCIKKIAAMSRSERPTAIICAGLGFASGAWLGALESNLRIPEDISFLSFDSNAEIFPRMSSLEQPIDEYVSKIIAMANNAERSGGLHKAENYEYDIRIVERGSCRNLYES